MNKAKTLACELRILITAIVFTMVFMLTIVHVKAQQQDFSSNFFALESNGNVLLSWIINEGSTCNGIDIYRATDTLNYTLIGHIPGVCGSHTSAQSFEFKDTEPITNTKVYYKISFGNLGYSNITSIEIISFNHLGVQVRPNPTSGLVRVYFENTQNRNFSLRLFTSMGKEILVQKSTALYFDMDLSEAPAGIYYYTVTETDGGQRGATGKLSVIH
jgi:hypothetical protein